MQKTLMTQEQQLYQDHLMGIFSMSTRIYTSRDLVKATGESLGISLLKEATGVPKKKAMTARQCS